MTRRSPDDRRTSVEIASVRARTIVVPLDRPVRTSNLVIDARSFVLVEVRTSDGVVGHGLGFTRDGLVAETVVRNLAPLLVGMDARHVEACWQRMYGGTRYLGRRGLLMRAISAVDIALWDVKGKAVGAPIWSLLGGFRTRVPVYVAGGYYGPSTEAEAVAAEFRAYRDSGYAGAKLNVGALPFDRDLARVAAAKDALGTAIPLGVDLNGALTTARDGVRWADALADLGVAFMEEPFLMEDRASLAGFRSRSKVPVAMGEDESARWAFAELVRIDALDILRHDVTLVGGASEWVKVAGLGLAHNLLLFPHWFPEYHVHMAAAYPSCLGVEVVAPESGVMDIHKLIVNPVTSDGGVAEAPTGPGWGIEWDWDAIERYGA